MAKTKKRPFNGEAKVEAKRLTTYRVVLTVKAANIQSVGKQIEELFGYEAAASIRKAISPISRADRLEAASQLIETAKADIEELRDEIQGWYDNLPEAFQSGDKGNELEQCVSELEEIVSSLDVDCSAVSFPGMY